MRPSEGVPDSLSCMAKPTSTVDTVVNLCKRRGFVFPCGEIYGGTRSAWAARGRSVVPGSRTLNVAPSPGAVCTSR